MRLAEALFVSETVDALPAIVYSLRRDIPVFRLWCVCLCGKRLEIQSARSLCTPYGKSRDWLVLGVAMGRQACIELLEEVFTEAVAKGIDLTDYSGLLRLVQPTAGERQDCL